MRARALGFLTLFLLLTVWNIQAQEAVCPPLAEDALVAVGNKLWRVGSQFGLLWVRPGERDFHRGSRRGFLQYADRLNRSDDCSIHPDSTLRPGSRSVGDRYHESAS
jgi:hypothetical protein